MLLRIVAFVAAMGVAFVAAGVLWRYVSPRFVAVPCDDDLASLAVRDGVAVSLFVSGVGIALVAVGTLELLSGLVDAGRLVEALVVLATVLPVREAGGLLVVGGFGLLGGSLLVPTSIETVRRFRE
ncbi:hypothetical protein [Halorussus sp. MSC15.2]|uniref:hypothetical protein n=1 Tax=Halorussus sp. MSC15.2 TaxID=2283638 RepID=UPI0013D831B7|nr:hypothetical protein [Halorussus sp. MSC15.2]NEU56251.1 hypothetical protein [Halorussus sp. MSC15.2]